MPFILLSNFLERIQYFFRYCHLSRASQGYTKRGGWLSSHQCNSGTQSSTWLWVQAAQAPLQNSEGLWLLFLTHHDATAHHGQLNPSTPFQFPFSPSPQLSEWSRTTTPLHQSARQPHPWSSHLCLALSGSPCTTETLKGKIWLPYSAANIFAVALPYSFNVKWILGSSLVKWRETCFTGLLWELNGIM